MCDTDDGFQLHAELGNATFSQPGDIADALEVVAGRLRCHELEGSLRDANGNTVGSFKFRHPGSDYYEPSERPTTEDLEALPVLSQGQADDLHIDTGTERVWLSRTGVADGEPFDNTVTVERLVDGRWVVSEKYNGDDTGEDAEPAE